MAQFDSSIIFRQTPYAGPTADELQSKQNLNALRNTLGEGYGIDDPKVVNAMMARDPDMGLKLMTNANSMRKSASDVATAEQERMTTELDRYVPLAMAVAQGKDQPAWSELRGELAQVFPSLGRSLPTDVGKALPAIQAYYDARVKMKGGSQALPFQFTELGGQLGVGDKRSGAYAPVYGPDGQPLVSNPVQVAGINAEREIQKTQMTTDTSRANAQLSADTRTALAKAGGAGGAGSHRLVERGGLVFDHDQATGQYTVIKTDDGTPLTATALQAAQARGEIAKDIVLLREEGLNARQEANITAQGERQDKSLESKKDIAGMNIAGAADRTAALIEGRANLTTAQFNNKKDLVALTNAAALDQLDAKSRAAAERQLASFEQQAALLKDKTDAASIQQMAAFRQKAELLTLALAGKLDLNDAQIQGRLQALDQKAVYDATNLGERLATQRDIAEMNTMSREAIAAMRVAAGGTADKPIMRLVDKKLYEVRRLPTGETILVEPPVGTTGKTLTETAAAKSVAGATVTYRDILKDVDDLAKGGGIVQTGESPINNLAAAVGASGLGQTVGGALGTKNQELRDKIVRNSKNLLLNLGLTSTQLNTEKEVQFWLDSVGSVVQSREAFDGAWESFAAKWNAGHPDQPVPATAAELRAGGAAPASTTTSSGIPVVKW
jgi:hypothetical protein